MKKPLLLLLLFMSCSLSAFEFPRFFDFVDRGNLEKMMETLEKLKPSKEPLPYFRTMGRGLAKAMEWRFHEDVSIEKARDQTVTEIQNTNLSDEQKLEMIEAVEFLAKEPEGSLWARGKEFFSKEKKKEEAPPFKMGVVEIFYGSLLVQLSSISTQNFGNKMIADGMRRLEKAELETKAS